MGDILIPKCRDRFERLGELMNISKIINHKSIKISREYFAIGLLEILKIKRQARKLYGIRNLTFVDGQFRGYI